MFRTDISKEDNRVVLYFLETRKGLLPFTKKVEERDLRDWSVRAGASGALAHAEISRLADEMPMQVVETEKSLILYHKALARLSNNTLKALGLPLNPSLAFHLEQRGSLRSGDLRIVAKWTKGGREVRTGRNGVFLTRRGEEFVIPDPIFEILSVLDRHKGDKGAAVVRQMDLVASILDLVTREGHDRDPHDDGLSALSADLDNNSLDSVAVKLDTALSKFKVKTAGAVSFDVTFKNERGYHIKPVLFAKVPEEGKSPVSERQGLLTREERLIFESDPSRGFFSAPSAKRTYLLESGEYILIDEVLFPAIDHVRRLETAEPEVREAFATNPSMAIAEIYRERLLSEGRDQLSDDLQQEQLEQILSSIIVETKEFSDRVTELGLWEPPVVPWVKRQPNSWEPEEFGIYLGSSFITLPPDEVEELERKIDQAMAERKKTVQHKGQSIPATDNVKAVLSQLMGMVKPGPKLGEGADEPEGGSEDNAGGPVPSSGAPAGQEVLLIKDNFDELKFRRELTGRPDYIGGALPASVKTDLMDHQEVSFSWQIDAYCCGLPGVLNADDQGLGKTLQTIAFMAWLQENLRKARSGAEKKPILVVAPTTLLKNWGSEVEQHMQGMFALGTRIDAYGPGLQRLKCEAGDGTTYLDLGLDGHHDNDKLCWVLTTYQTLAQNQVEFAKVDFATVVFDEIQNVKNVTTLAHRAAQSLKADFVVGLTGTPVENTIAELWAIMDTIAPGCLGSLRDFMDRFKDAGEEEYRRLHGEIFEASYSADAGAPPVGIRRMKGDTVKNLPLKNYRLYPAEMPELQAMAYDTVFFKLKNHVHGRALKILHQLRSVSLYPGNLQLLHNQPDALETMIANSARIKTAVEIMDEIRDRGEKVLLFLETHEMQHLLRMLLRERYGLNDVPILNGQTTPHRRGMIVDDFQRTRGDGKFDIRILSPKSAGVGITMTAATHIIHLSRWWNPAIEEQCNDRIYRIGQEMDCTVHIPLAVHPEHQEATFDCILNNIMIVKRKLFRDVLMPCEDAEADQESLIAGMTAREFDLKEIDRLDWKEFERWSGRIANDQGVWRAAESPRVGDGGLDTHLVHRERGDVVLVQCKYTDNHDKLMDESPVREVLHSVTRYDISKGHQCVVLTNAKGFDKQAQRLARENSVILVDRHRLALWPKHIV